MLGTHSSKLLHVGLFAMANHDSAEGQIYSFKRVGNHCSMATSLGQQSGCRDQSPLNHYHTGTEGCCMSHSKLKSILAVWP